MKLKYTFAAAILSTAVITIPAQAGTLENVKSKGYLNCGVSTGLAGFSQKNEKGGWSGLDVDVCRGIAAAVLGDAAKVKYKLDIIPENSIITQY